jgi:hypothetical protein
MEPRELACGGRPARGPILRNAEIWQAYSNGEKELKCRKYELRSERRKEKRELKEDAQYAREEITSY